MPGITRAPEGTAARRTYNVRLSERDSAEVAQTGISRSAAARMGLRLLREGSAVSLRRALACDEEARIRRTVLIGEEGHADLRALRAETGLTADALLRAALRTVALAAQDAQEEGGDG